MLHDFKLNEVLQILRALETRQEVLRTLVSDERNNNTKIVLSALSTVSFKGQYYNELIDGELLICGKLIQRINLILNERK